MKLDDNVKIKEWYDSSIGQSTVLQRIDKKRPKLSNLNQTQNRRKYVNFENGSHFICSFNLNNPEMTVCIAFRMNNIVSADGGELYLNTIFGNNNGNKAKYITFYRTYSGLGLLISTSYYDGSNVAVANDGSTFINPDYKFPSSKSNCTIFVTWSNRNNISNCWSNGEKLMTFNLGNAKGYDHCFIGDLGIGYGRSHLIGCIGDIIGFYRSLTDTETSNIHKYLMKKWT